MGKLPFEAIKREVLIKKDSPAETKERRPEDMPVEELINYGVVNIDKPPGPTSHQVSDYVQKILSIKKAGHSGTLDPNVTGVLPIAVERATRIVQTLLVAGKEYVGIMHLHKDVPEERLKEVFKDFTGKIRQKPPIKSAVKRQWRDRTVYYFDILERDGKDVLFRVGCEAGTYIRKLCSDMGHKLKTGAHMSELRRTKAGPFDESTLFTLQDLADAYWYYKNENNEKYIRKVIQPVENAVRHLPKIWVMDTAIESLCHGADLKMPGISKIESGICKGDALAVMTLKDELIALGEASASSEEMIKLEKGYAAITNKVFMEPSGQI